MDATVKVKLDVLKTTSRKLVHKAAEATGEFIRNKFADKTVKSAENLTDVEEIISPLEKREEKLNELKQVL